MRRRELLNASNGGNGRKMIGNYEVVDLGLPSGLLWATCNVGAYSETSYGDYYMYGKGTQTYNYYDYHYEGMENPLASRADTATQVLGSGWRMPTMTELQDLIDNTNYEWVTNFNRSGINGGKFTSKTNPNAYVFFPAAGYYFSDGNLVREGSVGYVWSSTPSNEGHAYLLGFGSEGKNVYNNDRDFGWSVRGVHNAV